MKRIVLVMIVAVGLAGCAGFSSDKCKGYAALAKVIALQLAEEIDPASAEGVELRERWANVAKEAVHAGCDQWAEPPPPLPE